MDDFSFHEFGARYAGGFCELCGESFAIGDVIGYDENEDLVHADCWREFSPTIIASDQPRNFVFER